MKIFMKWLPVVVVLTTIFNLIAAYGAGNTSAVYANISALCGWTALAFDSLTNPIYKTSKE